MEQADRQVVLVVDDAPENLRLMKAILATANYGVEMASDGPSALQIVKRLQPDLVLLDVQMPGMDGYEVCRQLRADEATQHIPVIFVTGMADAEDETRGFAVGGEDYLTKPVNPSVVLARVRTHLALSSQRRSLEGMFRDVIEFAPDAFVLADPGGAIVQMNARAEQLFGYNRKELIGVPVETLIPPHLRRGHEAYRQGYNRQPDNIRMGADLMCLRKDGTEFPADINLSLLQTNRGKLMVTVVRDVSERQRQEDQLREAARYSRSLIETSLDPFVMIDTLGVITDVNLAAEQITGLTREQLIGSDAASKFTEPDKLYQGYQKVVAEGQVIDWPMTIRHVSGKLVDVQCNANVYRDAGGEIIGVFASARDVTESRRVQEEVRTSRQRLREFAAQSEAVREEEKKRIARDVHDELGQVLTALRMDLSFLNMQGGERDPALTEKILDMRSLVDRAIQGVRNVAGNLRPAALDMGLVSAIEWLCTEFFRHTGIPCTLHAEHGAIELDDTRAVVLFRIVQESLTNITRYAKASRVTVSLERRGGNSLWLEVRDNGQGFGAEDVLKKKTFGLLGMRERAIALGGRVEIISSPGQGTVIDLTVPMDFASAKDAS